MAGVVQKARDEGRQQGMNRGRVEGERALLRRFGLLPPEAAERVDQAWGQELESWTEKVLDASTLDEVFGSSH